MSKLYHLPARDKHGNISLWPGASGVLLTLLIRGARIELENGCYLQGRRRSGTFITGHRSQGIEHAEYRCTLDHLRRAITDLRHWYENDYDGR